MQAIVIMNDQMPHASFQVIASAEMNRFNIEEAGGSAAEASGRCVVGTCAGLSVLMTAFAHAGNDT